MIKYGKHYVDKHDINEVKKALKSDFLTQGPFVEKFQKKILKFFGGKYCLAVSSGTAALHLAGLALGWKKNDIIIVSPLTFVASANSALYCGSKVIFSDINEKTLTLDVNKLEKKIQSLIKSKKKVNSVVVTDFGGYPADWVQLKKLSKKLKFSLINDNCHAMGSKYLGSVKYAQKFADIVVQSYHPVKNFTSGEGGSLITNNFKIYQKIIRLKQHDIHRTVGEHWKYDVKNLGYNYRMSDIHAALGNSQIDKLRKFVNYRIKVAKIYNKNFRNIKGITIPTSTYECKSSYHLYPLHIDFKKFRITKDNFLKKLLKQKISLQVHYVPIHFFSLYKKTVNSNFPVAENFYKGAVSLPVYYKLNQTQINLVIRLIKQILKINTISSNS